MPVVDTILILDDPFRLAGGRTVGIRKVWSISYAICVIQDHLLHLRAGIQQQTSDGREDDADGEEEGEHGFRSEDRPVLSALNE